MNMSKVTPVKVKFNQKLESTFGSADSTIQIEKKVGNYRNEVKIQLDEPDSATPSMTNSSNKDKKIRLGSFDDSNVASPKYIKDRIESLKKHLGEEETKTYDLTHMDTIDENEIDRLEQYLSTLGGKVSKESPILPDENRIEIGEHRKSGKSISPTRQSVKGLIDERYKDSTHLPLTSSLSSEDIFNMDQDEDIILDELLELYHVFLGWIFTSKNEVDCARPIRYHMMVPLCLNLAAKSTKLMKKKAISDFNFMTAIEKNCSIIMGEKTFNRWMLDLLSTVFPPKSDSEKDPIWEMGCKLYIQVNKI